MYYNKWYGTRFYYMQFVLFADITFNRDCMLLCDSTNIIYYIFCIFMISCCSVMMGTCRKIRPVLAVLAWESISFTLMYHNRVSVFINKHASFLYELGGGGGCFNRIFESRVPLQRVTHVTVIIIKRYIATIL